MFLHITTESSGITVLQRYFFQISFERIGFVSMHKNYDDVL